MTVENLHKSASHIWLSQAFLPQTESVDEKELATKATFS